MKSVSVIGGGIAGLLAAIQLAEAGVPCTLFEKKSYPQHRVCGEYISNESVPFLDKLKLYPASHNPAKIRRFLLSSVSGKHAESSLDLGGFGISRFTFDDFLFRRAVASGVNVLTDTPVENVEFLGHSFKIATLNKTYESDVVIAAYGKRSILDTRKARAFTRKRSPFLGVKYHVRTHHPSDLVALHNFEGGYCGINRVENDLVNVCYLVHRDQLKAHGSIPVLEEKVLFRNPFLKNIFSTADFIFSKPLTINEISFATKRPVEDHLLMTGDSAGMITPLCGNGMAMAMHASMIAAKLVTRFSKDASYQRAQLERDYSREWSQVFATRLWLGRQIQKLFGSQHTSGLAVSLMKNRSFAQTIIRNTHGKPFG